MAWGKIFGIGVVLLVLSLSFHPAVKAEREKPFVNHMEELKLKIKEMQNKSSFTFVGNLFHIPFLIASFCKINAVYVISGDAKLGLSIAGIKKFWGSSTLSYDFVDSCWGGLGMVEAKGLARDHMLLMMPGMMMNIGFIGTHVHIPALMDVYHGYSMLTFAAGLGMKSITFNSFGFFIIGLIIGIVAAYLIQSSSTP